MEKGRVGVNGWFVFFAGRGREMARAGMLHRGGKNGAE